MTEHTIRLPPEVWKALWAYRNHLAHQITTRPGIYPADMRQKHLSLGDAVAWLLRDRVLKKKRQERYQQRLSQRTYTPTDLVGTNSPQDETVTAQQATAPVDDPSQAVGPDTGSAKEG